MEAKQVKQRGLVGLILSVTLIIAILAVFFVAPMFLLLHFQEQIRQAQAYGYLGVLAVGLLCGITVIPAPTQILVFAFGHVLNPWLVGIIAGFGSGLGGITVYLTGAGMQSIWSRLRSKQIVLERKLRLENDNTINQSKFWELGKAFYNRLEDWISGRKGNWALFITSALFISPFYPAGLAAGSMKMGLRRFFLVSWAGRTVRYLYIAMAGYLGLEFISRLLK